MSTNFNSVPSKILASSITATSSTFRLRDILGWDGQPLTASDFGTVAWAVFANATRTQIEIMEFNPTTIGSTDITINKRGMKFLGDLTTEVTANKLDWTKDDTSVQLGTDTPQSFQWLKKYIDDIAIAGAPNASTTAKGVSEEATQAEIDADTAVGETGAPLFTNPSTLATSKYGIRLPSAAEKSAMAGNGGTPSGTNKFVTEEGAISATATFGDGADGDIVLDGTNTFAFLSKSGSVYTMTRDIYANNLTINAGSTLEPAGFRIFVKETFGGAGTVRYNGNNGNANTGQTLGAGGVALSTTGFFKNLAGGNGSHGATSGHNASSPAAPTATNPSIGVSGARGGRGGGRNDTDDVSVAGGVATAPVLKYPTMRSLVIACLDLNNSGVLAQLLGTAASSGGAGGHGYITASGIGGGGGGAGATGGTIFLACKTFAGTVTFQVIGGNGGNASAIGGNGGNGGGGAGGSGGVVIVIYGVKTGTPTYTLTSGTGGTAVANGQAPNIAAAGANGNNGVNYEIPIKNLL